MELSCFKFGRIFASQKPRFPLQFVRFAPEFRCNRLRGTAGLFVLFCALSLCSCELFDYGKLGGADKSDVYYPGDPEFEAVLQSLSGVWYSSYAGIGRLDGYRIGKWENFPALAAPKAAAIFPDYQHGISGPYIDRAPLPGDYFVLYDDTVYGEQEDGYGGNGGFEFFPTRYMGVVRALSIFNGDMGRGAVIIEYFEGCAPQWDRDIRYGQRPFFGIFYRAINSGTVQMANAVDLAALYAGKKYYTEQPTLRAAIELNTVENEAEFISWGVVIPQQREQP
jgi:hypothetical protein